jgi:tripartite-type tricarboxylate transporter receptor subunit TctC
MKSVLSVAFALAMIGVVGSGPAHGQAASNKPVALIVPFTPGGGTDVLTRIIAPRLAEKLGTSTIVENRPGASGAIAAQFTARSAPDGKTLMIGSTSEIGINPSLYPKLPYDVTRDFVAVTPIAATPMVLVVHPSSPIKTAKDLVTMAQANPGKINFGSAGAGSGAHMAAELFLYATKTKLTHVPYKGVGAALIDLIGTQRDMVVFTTLPSITAFVQSGQLRAVAVSTRQRVSTLPETPTFIESGVPSYEMEYWYGLMAPAATPADISAKLHAAMGEVLRQPAVIASLDKQGLQPATRTPEEFAAFIKADMEKWAAVVKAANIKLDQ